MAGGAAATGGREVGRRPLCGDGSGALDAMPAGGAPAAPHREAPIICPSGHLGKRRSDQLPREHRPRPWRGGGLGGKPTAAPGLTSRREEGGFVRPAQEQDWGQVALSQGDARFDQHPGLGLVAHHPPQTGYNCTARGSHLRRDANRTAPPMIWHLAPRFSMRRCHAWTQKSRLDVGCGRARPCRAAPPPPTTGACPPVRLGRPPPLCRPPAAVAVPPRV